MSATVPLGPAKNYRFLGQEKLVETAADLQRRLAADFPGSGLGQVADDLRRVIDDARKRVEAIRRPSYGLRVGAWLLSAGLVALVLRICAEVKWSFEKVVEPVNFVQFVDSSLTSIAFLSAGIVTLVTLEARVKRQRALKALHELRAMAHIIDLHQLRKDPVVVIGPDAITVTGMNEAQTARYLDYCSDLLALLGTTAALYVQQFPDAVALEAVDQVQALVSGLSQKIWQKIMLMNRPPSSLIPP